MLQTLCFFFFFNDTATTEIYTLSLHDALPILSMTCSTRRMPHFCRISGTPKIRSEEHTSELQSLTNLVCRLLLEKKKKPPAITTPLFPPTTTPPPSPPISPAISIAGVVTPLVI